MRKPIICLFLALSFVLSAAMTPALATSIDTETIEDLYVGHATIAQKKSIITSLQHAENLKDELGLENIPFSDIFIGNKIHIYHYTDAGFEESRLAFPLFYNGTLIALARETDNGHYQISTALANEIEKINSPLISIIYDLDSCYLFDGSDFILLRKNSVEVESRSSLSSDRTRAFMNTSQIKICDLSLASSLNYEAPASTMSTTTYYTHDVDYVSQFPPSPSYICWAATIACIKNSVDSSSSLTAIDVAKKQYGSTDYNKTLLHSTAATLMKNSYNLNYTYKTSVPSSSVICTNIKNDKPIFGIFSYVISSRSTSKGYHDVTIHGINTSSGYVEVMDPEFGATTAYKSGSIYTYISEWSDVNLTWVESICSSW